jgi:hypothetical protein
MNEIPIRFEERNLAHFFSALALCGIADEKFPSGQSRCWWTNAEFYLLIPKTGDDLVSEAYNFVSNIKWIPGIGCDEKGKMKASPHNGLYVADNHYCGNPLINYHDQGVSSSVYKTFSGQQGPDDILEKQKAALVKPPIKGKLGDWLFQKAKGVASWKFDARVGGHAYNQGFSANDDKSADQTPFYPAIELLSIAGAAFFSAGNAWLSDEDTLIYSVWRKKIPPRLAPIAAASLLDGVDAVSYSLAPSANSFGKGASYKHFSVAFPIKYKQTLQTQQR